VIDAATRKAVRDRAGDRCEYCCLHQDHSPLAKLQFEHIIPKKHRGTDDLDNLALACIDCNLSKSSNIAGFDPQTNELTELFNPRHHTWHDHFEWQQAAVVGKTSVGRTTVYVFNLNSEERIELRLLARGQ